MKNKSKGLSRRNFEKMVNILKSFGYKEGADLYDFYAKNEEKIRPTRFGEEIYDGIFSQQVRWHYVNGKVLEKSIREYIEKKVKESDENQLHLFLRGGTQIQKQIIDFSDWECDIHGHKYTLANSRKIPIETKGGEIHLLLDFCGINLSGIKITGCEIKNVSFDGAFFDGATLLSDVELTNVTLTRASFHRARLSNVFLNGATDISSAYFDCTRVERINNLSNSTVRSPIIYSEPSYWWLIKELFYKMIKSPNWFYKLKKKINPKWNRKDKTDLLFDQSHTVFILNETEQLTSPKTKELRDYINWFQSLIDKIYGFRYLRGRKKLEFTMAIISTKYWSSFRTLGYFAFFVDFLFSLIYFGDRTDFYDLGVLRHCSTAIKPLIILQTFIKSFYYSTVTFMTLGYGDIYPLAWEGQIIVIFEVMLGYIVLGLFVYLISRKVDKLY
ncbi:MAG TPA: ion channel [Bacteroidia bacterium]|jgi:hypothetical protein|nr:ion channel [Bacteroidia bacterium]